MRINLTLVGLLVLVLSLGACSKEQKVTNEPETMPDPLDFQSAIIGNLGTKANSYSYYSNGDLLNVGIISQNEAVNTAMNGKRTTTLKVVAEGSNLSYIPDPILYWNDMGGKNASINVWGAYLQNSKVSVSEFGALAWSVAKDQTSGVLPNDLHWSYNVKGLTYKNVANMEFRHAMSKITINLVVGEGFNSTEAVTSTCLLKDNFTTANIDIPSASVSNAANVSDITPAVVSAIDASLTSNFKATYEAIIVPTKSVEIGDVISVINVAGSVFYVKSKEKRTFESGKNYIYNVSVKKSGITFVTSTIVDWEEVEGSADSKIIFSSGDSGAENGTGPNALNNSTTGFDIFSSKDNTNYDSDATTDGTQPATSVHWVEPTGTEGSDDYVPGHWENDIPLYWDNDNDQNYFRAISPVGQSESDNNGNFTLTTGNEDYIWGTSGNDPSSPTTGSVPLTFKHIMAKVVLTVITTDGDDAVDLTTISTQNISNIATTAKFNVVTGTYADFTAANYGSYDLDLQAVEGTNNKKYSCEFYVFPQTLGNDAKVNVTVGVAPVENAFYQQLNLITVNGNPLVEWEAGKRYVYTIRLKKSAKTFTAILTDWEDVITDDNDAEL